METNKKKLKQLEAEFASIKKRHEKGKNAVSRKTSAKRKHYTICCRPHRTSRRNHSRTCTKYYFKKESLTKKRKPYPLSVTLSRNRNMISASAILSIILSVFHKIPVQIKNVRLSCRSFLRRRRHHRRNFPNCCWIQYDV